MPRTTRRAVLQGLAATAAAAWSFKLPGAEGAPALIERPIPSSGEKLPIVGLGTWKVFDVGGGAEERAPLREVLSAFVEGGAKLVDSSPMYGRAEGVVGDLAADLGIRDRLFLATKVWTRGREEGIEQIETSFRRMRAKTLDLLQVHNLVDLRVQLETLRRLKAEGRVRYIGVTHYTVSAHPELERVLRETDGIDFVQLNYSLATREAEERLLPLAADRGVAVIVNRPFETGSLFSRTRGKPLPAWATELGCTSWAQVFLKYVLGNPAVTCAIPATSKLDHLVDNLAAGRGRLPGAEERARMVSWERGA